jgi:hypothetical protein
MHPDVREGGLAISEARKVGGLAIRPAAPGFLGIGDTTVAGSVASASLLPSGSLHLTSSWGPVATLEVGFPTVLDAVVISSPMRMPFRV